MTLFVIIIIVLLNKWLYKSYLNPIFLQSVLWLFYYVILSLNIDRYDVYLPQVNGFILLQLLGFAAGGFLCYLFVRRYLLTSKVEAEPPGYNILRENVLALYPVVLCLLLVALFFIARQAGIGSIFNLAEFRQELSADDGKAFGLYGFLHYIICIYLIAYITIFGRLDLKLLFFLLPFFLYTLLLGSRAQFIFFFLPIFYLIIWQKKMPKKALISIGVALLFFIIVITVLRSPDVSDRDVLIDIALIYSVTALPALVLIQEAQVPVFGYYTLRIPYLWLNKIGFDFPVAPVVSEFVATPLYTNVYSYIKPYYLDFGYWGVFVFPFILGVVHNIFYFRSKANKLGSTILNALLIYPLFMQLFEENYFRWASNWVYFSIIIILLTKFRLYGFWSSNRNISSAYK